MASKIWLGIVAIIAAINRYFNDHEPFQYLMALRFSWDILLCPFQKRKTSMLLEVN
jgi:hypothetical protein